MNNFQFKIVTPESVLLETECIQVDLPASEGRMGVLAGHMNMVAMLEPGLVEIFTANNKRLAQFIIADGFAEISATQCVLLVEQGIELSMVNVEEFEIALNKYQQELTQATLAIEIEMLTNQIKFLQIAVANKSLTK